jgi:predicted AAA+ superfamily ATPase
VYSRLLEPPVRQSFFLFGPRGVGKTAWLKTRFPDAPFFDLLDSETYTRLLASPSRLGDRVPADYRGWVVIDEIQRLPDLLNEVHRLIESRRLRFVMTGSSARKFRQRGVNLLAGRALTRFMHPLTAAELGQDFDLRRAVRFGCLPFACTDPAPEDYLRSYVTTYLREEVQQEGLTRNLAAFARFLEAASFSQGSVLNMAAVARESAVGRKVVEDYFSVLDDLLIGVRLPIFTRRAKRRLVAHPKFYLFDAGVFQAVRPRGPLDAADEIRGAALETLFLQQLRAVNDYLGLGYSLHYWRTALGDEVDFVLYGARGLVAFEVKATPRVRPEDLRGLRRLREDYPQAKAFFVYTGSRRWHERGIEVVPAHDALRTLADLVR